ncbi:50S ribosomal protein L29 [Candidatus Methylacidiphilum fumarolicum]|uniref:Large ribosomal subunit protein uL29 n=2 Tax=Candidatus Methylacidiphilum fumarolicum TaxID=591154 RepID=I0K0D4_METFB|nr:50S ribosomal protein L29 [Candidatus Methylacidiphilum fumarolicum]MBW6414538.1 50S ribosomal protein L29 [Candidatus Methylacidiphilum fumarolicum]TFE65589.1 50S ribosomal protein L29 [Candidatus Methylacidiphilum fumarolicum]TFE73691.1 50S ribosomal protein L29 [Candidatus Methylacidiphilum fumarolicum]TFE75378.1 50S ribosomal protein L29 [Candidatus Methylacidiphilum fumarolicum]TFE77449.1 50S ribosomal protein L29 [Candidatus Methylacidiphilum fumarolicum]
MKSKNLLTELRSLGKQELLVKEQECREELFRLRMQKSTAQLEKPSRIKELKKMIARIKTVSKQKFAEEGK